MPSYARKVDDNQAQIVKQLRRCGYSVAITSSMGKGFPDIVVGARGSNYLFEIKDPDKVPSARKLTKDEQTFFDSWNGQINKVETVEEILGIIK